MKPYLYDMSDFHGMLDFVDDLPFRFEVFGCQRQDQIIALIGVSGN